MSAVEQIAAILSVGDEVVSGAIVDTNAAWLAGQLSELGFRVRILGVARDERADIAEILNRAMEAACVVIVTGGLGPTADDLSREGLADALAVTLQHSAEAEQQITAFYARLDRRMPGTTMRQARIPLGCGVIANPWGTAPGVSFQGSRSPGAEPGGHSVRVYLLPGVPGEMKNMFAASIRPQLERMSGDRRMVRRMVRTFGMSEAAVGELLEDLMAPDRNPHVGVTASEAVISVRINATADTAMEAERLAGQDVLEVRRRVGEAVFGEDDATLAGALGELLRQSGRTLATAESCTGGMLAQLLTDVPGASGYFLRGYVTYSDLAKSELLGVPPELIRRQGAVSEEVARNMAEGCRRAAGTDFALSITGIAGPAGGGTPGKPVGLVWFGLADATGTTARRVLFGEHLSRAQIRDRASKTALNLLRLVVLKRQEGSTRV